MATEQEYKAAIVALKEATDNVKKTADEAKAEMKNLGTLTAETKNMADKALLDMNTLSARLTEMEQKMARRPGEGAPTEVKSIGARVTDSDEYKAMAAKGGTWRGTAQFEVKNITSASTTGASGTTGLVVADRQPGIVQVLPNRQLVVRNLLMPGNTTSGAIDYVRETVFTNNADMVEENPDNVYPQSELKFDLQSLPVRTVAHWMLASKQILSDAPMLSSYIDGRLRYGLAYKEDDQLLNGDGTGENLKGLMIQASNYAAPAGVNVANETMIDRLRLAMLQATLALFPATGHVLNPIDWASIELTKDGQQRYVFANPTGLASPSLWGLPVVESLAIAQNTFLTGAFRYAAQLFDREDATVIISTEDRDNLTKGMVTILAEERLGLAVYRPQALIKGTFAAPAGG